MEYLYSRDLPWDVFLEETILPLYTAYVVSCLGKHFIQSDGFNIYITLRICIGCKILESHRSMIYNLYALFEDVGLQ